MARILFVSPTADWSTADVARGYRAALIKRGHDIRDFRLGNRVVASARMLPESLREDRVLVSRLASEGLVIEALRHEPDLLVVINGHNLHPDAMVLLRRACPRLPVVAIFTESPYEDDDQAYFAQFCDRCYTHDRYSARVNGWGYLAHAYDPVQHYPMPPDPDYEADVLFVATGFSERQRFLEAVDWTGIKLLLLGYWPELPEDSPLRPYLREQLVDNDCVPPMYAAAKVCLNHHRYHAQAESLNPRAYELAACGAFQVSDYRPELAEVFGQSVPTYRSPEELGHLVRRYLADPAARRARAELAHTLVALHTFDARVTALEADLENRGLLKRKQSARPDQHRDADEELLALGLRHAP